MILGEWGTLGTFGAVSIASQINVLDVTTDEVASQDTTTRTISLTPQAGSNRCLLVVLNFETAADVFVNSVQWDGVNLEEVEFYSNPLSGAPKNGLAFYIIKESSFPSTVSNLVVSCSPPIGNNLTTIAIQLDNIDQENTVADVAGNNITASSNLTLSSSTNSFYLWCGNEGSGAALPSLSPENTSVLSSNFSDMSCVCSYLNNETGDQSSTVTMPDYTRALFGGIVLQQQQTIVQGGNPFGIFGFLDLVK